jgi:hypothetical protein
MCRVLTLALPAAGLGSSSLQQPQQSGISIQHAAM